MLTYFNIGGPGTLLPLDVWVHDSIGLVNPVAVHSTTVPGLRYDRNTEKAQTCG
ncbi:hypothetical protein [Amycolatopsis decaplanina]|uniref:hypothetical protein n=1 Tax=Amycolatopsis decaplanina TaxID=208441 RepID=UPI00034D3E64|nr:hypothetical protein [Amycolatopsis decaplanina]